MTISTQVEQTKKLHEKEGKYLTFSLGSEQYGLEILKVREIIEYMEITVVPQTPPYVKGVINPRGQVIPVVDLRTKFQMPCTEISDETCIIVVETHQNGHKYNTGIIVDHVQEVLYITGNNIEEPPQFDNSSNTDYILAMAKTGDSLKILLDIDKVLCGCDISQITKTQDSGE